MTRKGKRIAEGRTAEILAWGDDRVLKLYRPDFPSDDAGREAAHARAVHNAGVKTPAAIDLIEHDGRKGVLYERVSGPTMLRQMVADPGKGSDNARLLAELHADMHGRFASGLPDLKDRLRRLIERAPVLPNVMKAEVLALLDELPDGKCICHGDFHPDNILMTTDGPVIVDWVDATQGHPLADVARSCLLLELAMPHDGSAGAQIAAMRRRFLEVYLDRYRELRPFDETDLVAWRRPVAAARLDEVVSAGEIGALLSALSSTRPS